MKRQRGLLVLLTVCLFFIGNTAFAEDSRFYVGVYGMYALEGLDEDQTKEKFNGPIEVDFDSSWGAQVRGGYIINKLFTAEAILEYVTPFEAETGTNEDELDVLRADRFASICKWLLHICRCSR